MPTRKGLVEVCKSLEEGGQRCPAHTRPRFTAAMTAVQELPADAAPAQRLECLLALEEAAREYASTAEGQIAVPESAALAQVQGHPERAALLLAAAERGRQLREANQEVARQVEHAVERQAMQAAAAPDGLESTYLQREREAEEAEEAYEAAKREVEGLQERLGAGVRPGRQDQCAGCGHRGHDGGPCRASVQVMSDIWEACSCAGHRSPTAEQIQLADTMGRANLAFQRMLSTRATANAFIRGDCLVVARGRKVPRGTQGRLIRLWDGQYGPRALLRTDDGRSVWVDARNLERDLHAEEGLAVAS